MKLISLAKLDSSLDFQPRSGLDPALPAFCWSNLQISGFGRGLNDEAIQLETSFAKAFFQAHPRLNLSELSRLYSLLQDCERVTTDDTDALLFAYKVKPSSQNKRLLVLVPDLPQVFIDWCDEKSCKPGDLICLLSAGSSMDLESGLLKIAESNASLSNGLKALELYVELSLMGKTSEIDVSLPFEKWLKSLVQARFPLRAAKELGAKAKLKKITWPSRVEPKWQSRGDADSLILKLELRSSADFAKKLKDLEKCLHEIEQDNPWTT